MVNLVVNIDRRLLTRDSGFDESKHKRDDGGKFSTTSAGGGAKDNKSLAAESAARAKHYESHARVHRAAMKSAKTDEERSSAQARAGALGILGFHHDNYAKAAKAGDATKMASSLEKIREAESSPHIRDDERYSGGVPEAVPKKPASDVVKPGSPADKAEMQQVFASAPFGMHPEQSADKKALNPGGGRRKGLTDTEDAVLSNYCGGGDGEQYEKINSSLRSGKPRTEDEERALSVMDRALDKLPSAGRQTLHRGLRVEKEDIEAFKARYAPGATVEESAYVSATANREHAKFFAGESDGWTHAVHIQMTGAGGRSVSDGGSLSREEAEYVFKRGSRFRVESLHTDKDGTVRVRMSQI